MQTETRLINNLTKIFGFGYTNMFGAVNTVISEHNVSETQIKIIEYIYIKGHAYPSELANMLEVNKSAVTQVLKKLEQNTLIEVRENTLTQDKRAKLVYLTQNAYAILEQLTKNIQAQIINSIDHLDTTKRKELEAASEVIMTHLLGGKINEKNITI